MDRHAALFVELLGGIEIQGVERSGAAEPLIGNVLQPVIDPGIAHRKDQRAVTADKNVFGLLRGSRFRQHAPTSAGVLLACGWLFRRLRLLRGCGLLGLLRG